MRPRTSDRRGFYKRNDDAPRVRVTLIKSWIGYDKRQEKIVRGLGLRRIGHSVDVVDNPSIRGMIRAIRHLVKTVEP
jgi:large subunit ribosomal protein L30